MSKRSFLATNLAAALLDGAWTLPAMRQRALAVTSGRHAALRLLVRRAYLVFPASPGPHAIDALIAWIMSDRGFQRLSLRDVPVIRSVSLPRAMAPSPWPVPSLPTATRLAEWFGITVGELEWFADCQNRTSSQPPGPLRHYTYRVIPKTRGRGRLIESPKKRLKETQRQILDNILNLIRNRPANWLVAS